MLELIKPFSSLWYRYAILRPQFKHYPSNIVIELTDRCNLRCSFCPNGKGIGGVGGDMDFELFKKIINEIRFNKIREVILVGIGEPLLYPSVIEAIEYVKASCDSKVSIITNGVLLTQEMVLKLINSGLDSLTLSINSSPGKYKEFTKSDKYSQVEQNTRDFLWMLNAGNTKMKLQTSIQILDTVNTNEEISEFKRFWQPYLSPNARVHVQPLVNWGGNIPVNKKIETKRHPCGLLQGSWAISREGNCFPCCVAFGYEIGDWNLHNLLLGNVNNSTLGELYSNGNIIDLLMMDKQGKLGAFNPCGFCDSWKVHPNVWFWNPAKKVWL
jgi:pyruvate-formate lyase-activating enzyme